MKKIFALMILLCGVSQMTLAMPSTPPYDPRPVPVRPGGPGSGPHGPRPHGNPGR